MANFHQVFTKVISDAAQKIDGIIAIEFDNSFNFCFRKKDGTAPLFDIEGIDMSDAVALAEAMDLSDVKITLLASGGIRIDPI